MPAAKQEIITFKVDADLWEALHTIPNRSQFIRSAILAALDGACPLCRGTGTLSESERKHWDAFAKTHSVEECDDCHGIHIVCEQEKPKAGRRARNAHP